MLHYRHRQTLTQTQHNFTKPVLRDSATLFQKQNILHEISVIGADLFVEMTFCSERVCGGANAVLAVLHGFLNNWNVTKTNYSAHFYVIGE